MSISLNSFRNVAINQQGNVKIKDSGQQQQEITARNSFKSRTVTWIKNALGLRNEKNLATINTFENTLRSSGKFDHAKVDSVFRELRNTLQNGQGKTLQASQVKDVLLTLGDERILSYEAAHASMAAVQNKKAQQSATVSSPTIPAGGKPDAIETMQQAMMTGGAAIIRDQLNASSKQLATNAHQALDLVKSNEGFDTDWSKGSGPLRSAATSMQSLVQVSKMDAQFKAQHAELIATMATMMTEPVGGTGFTQWGDPAIMNKIDGSYAEVRPQLLNFLERLVETADAVQTAAS